MRHILLLDNKIKDTDFEMWKEEDSEFWREHIGIETEYEIMRTDYSDYPTYIDQDGDIRASREYLQSLTDQVVSRYGQFGTDFIMVMIHEDNWKSDPSGPGGIWGTAYAYKFGKQALLYCRWDRDNSANTFGTAYHERHHALDAMIKVETGIEIDPIVPVTDWDQDITHGKGSGWDYIRHKENVRSLDIISPYLKLALKKRKDKHEEIIKGVLKQLINAYTQLLYLLRMKKNSKNGIPRT